MARHDGVAGAPEEDPMTKPIPRARPLCLWCCRRPALAKVRGEWRVVKHHDVCRQCWRSLEESFDAQKLAYVERVRATRKARDVRRVDHRDAPAREIAA